ncbi:MAG: hypothetical protein KIT83_19580, partial [Bryobacterales bacterium]|nr:hypothetical protein [Bryobacterales bacterium]
MKNSILMTIFALALGMALVSTATASPLGTIRADHDSSAFGFVDIKYSVTSAPSVSGTARAGAFLMKQLPDQPGDAGFGFDPLPGPNDPNFYAFCIELHDFIADGVLYDVVDLEDGRTNPNTTPALGSIGQDRAKLVQAVLGSAGFVNFNAPLQAIGAYSLAVTSAAIQVAIWEVIYETLDATDAFATIFNVSTGVAQFGTGQNSGAQAQVKALANSILSGLSATTLAPDILALNSKGNRTTGNSQDLIIQIPTPGNEEAIPEPGTLGLMGLGL